MRGEYRLKTSRIWNDIIEILSHVFLKSTHMLGSCSALAQALGKKGLEELALKSFVGHQTHIFYCSLADVVMAELPLSLPKLFLFSWASSERELAGCS